jgi:hypothetical protein
VGRLRQGDFTVPICVDLGEKLAGIWGHWSICWKIR